MSESVVASALLEIGKLLTQEAQYIIAVPDKVEHLQTELRRIQSFLKDADRRQDENETVRGWVSEIRELAYDAEDVVATFIVEVASRSQPGLFQQLIRYASIYLEITNLHMIGTEMDAIIAEIANLSNSLQTYGIQIKDDGSQMAKQLHLFRKANSYLVEDDTVGLINDKKILLEKLIGRQHEDPQKVISIYGMGGIGKTTLAGKLYHHNEVQRHFDVLAWVCISQVFTARQVLEETLSKLSTEQKENISKMSDEEVAKKLHQIQQKKKCLVVLDDIWSNEDWNAIKHAFPIEKIIGTILITTRSKPLGFHIHPRCFLHEAQILSEEVSWELFQRKADLHRTDSQDIITMKKLGWEMAKKCSGLPLAIIILGGVLATKRSINEWELIHKNVGKILQGGANDYSYLHAILALSYLDLPYHLKPCLLYLGQFPEDYSIHTTMLYRLWIAEGIVVEQPHGEETLEEIADGYLRELIDRCLVHIQEMGYCGRIKSCRLHDLIRDLALSKARQENYLQVIDGERRHSEAHRLVAYTSTDNVMNFGRKARVRSLLGSFDMKSLMVIGDFYMLRVLKIDNYKGKEEWVNEIGKLIHLKYLSLVECEIEYLPSSLGNLRYLETFTLKKRSYTLLIPEEFTWDSLELRHLTILPNTLPQESRHLIVKSGNLYNIIHAPIKLGNPRNLQTLRICGPIDANDSDKLLNLRKLTIRLNKVIDLHKVLESGYLNGLTTLSIRFIIRYHYREMVFLESDLRKLLLACGQLKKFKLFGAIEQFPDDHAFTPNLVKLVLSRSCLRKDPMPVLEKLPNLTWFHFYHADCYKLVCSSNGFPRLETLILDMFQNLVEWQVDEGAMASLRHLEISWCRELKIVPEGIKFINTLSLLKLNAMEEQFNNRVRVIEAKEGEDYYKVRHVPSIIFT